ncbi:MAG: 16S rRNA (cytosine(967)-C(5))-methyltransferase RsmB [Tepidanaerobacteraceae bacterium]
MVSPRELALKVLLEWQKGFYSNISLNKHLTNAVSSKDRALATELTYGVIQNKLKLDYIISHFSKLKIETLSPSVINILRLGIYQLVFLDKIPDFAAVNESVNLARKFDNRGSANYVNAVLRNVSRKVDKLDYPERQTDLFRYLSVTYSFPLWLVKRWVDIFGASFAEQLLKSLNERPKFCVRLNTLKGSCEQLKSRLIAENVKFRDGFYLDEAIYLESGLPVTGLESFKSGLIQPQDESSMLAAIALGVKPNEIVLDAAAAPGGKTTHMAQIMENAGSIVSWDIHPHRVKLIQETCRRLGVTIAKAYVKDISILDDMYYDKFDRVLIDAPCSGLGVIRRKPDIKWSKSEADLHTLNKKQYELLSTCSRYVKPNGILVYSTCSVDPEENERVALKFLDEHKNFSFDDITPHLPKKLRSEVKKPTGYIHFYPNVHKIDGFFITRLKRIY